MQTPGGHEVVEGRFMPASWLDVIFNASFPYRLAHTVTGFYLTTAFAVLGATAWHLKHRRNVAESQAVMGMTVIFIAIFVPIQIVAGDLHGLNTLHHQPLKVAAMEGLWDTQARAPAVLFAIPDEKAERNHAEIAIPALASIYLAHSPDAVIKGLKEAPPADRPPVAPVFFAFRIMVGIGVLMLGMAIWGVWLRWRGRLYTNRALPQLMHRDASGGLRRRGRRLDGHGSGTPAMGRLWTAAHARRRVTVAHGVGRAAVAGARMRSCI